MGMGSLFLCEGGMLERFGEIKFDCVFLLDCCDLENCGLYDVENR